MKREDLRPRRASGALDLGTGRENESMDDTLRPHTSEALTGAIAGALTTIDSNMVRFSSVFPGDTTVDGVYEDRSLPGYPEGANAGWTTSFWPGMLWLAYEITGEHKYRDAGSDLVESFSHRLHQGIDLETHDLGFLYTLGCVVPWRATGNEVARTAALGAADHLMTRFLEPAGIIQAWGDLNDPDQRGRTIIDSLMNTPLLYWASEQTGDSRYRDAAYRHTIQLRDHIVRDDDSTFHTFYWDAETGEPLRGATEQGHADDSCWARGQAWGIYGFAINYRLSGDETLLAASVRCADYFLRHLPSDLVPYWDLALSEGVGEPRDSSAAAIAATGLLELAEQLGGAGRAGEYRQIALDIIASLAATYSTHGATDASALIEQGVYNAPKQIGVDEGTLWGDYFYLESLARAELSDWKSPW